MSKHREITVRSLVALCLAAVMAVSIAPVPADAAGTLSAIRHSGADYLLIGASSQDPDYLEAYNEENARLAGHLRTLLRDGALTLVEVPGTGAYTLLKVN